MAVRLLLFVNYLLSLYWWVVVAGVVLSWLMAFNVVNAYNPFVRSLWGGLNAVTEPILRPIRRILPDLGGIDLSPIILLLGIHFMQAVVIQSLIDMVR